MINLATWGIKYFMAYYCTSIRFSGPNSWLRGDIGALINEKAVEKEKDEEAGFEVISSVIISFWGYP